MGISSRERAVQRQGPEIQCCISPLQQVEQEMRMEVALAATFGQAPFGTWHVKCGPWRRPHSGHTRRGRSRLSGKKKNARRPMPFILQTGKGFLSPCPLRKAGNIMTRTILLLQCKTWWQTWQKPISGRTGFFWMRMPDLIVYPSAQCSKLIELWQTSVSTKEMEREMTV